MTLDNNFPRFARLKQTFERPCVADIEATVGAQLSEVCREPLSGKRIAITAGSRGVANIARIIKSCVDFLKSQGAEPWIVPAMGSHGGATADGQQHVLETFGITSDRMGCPIHSSMEVVEVCQAPEGFPVYFDRHAFEADGVLVVNRIKPHTRFAGAIESGLMKMMLIGLGKQKGAEVYHRAIVNYSFDQIVRSVAAEVIARCKIVAGLAILENAYEETASIVGMPAQEIEQTEPDLLVQVKRWMPRLPIEKTELLIVDQIGKNISGTGMDTNVLGRKFNEHAAVNGDTPSIHHIYVRGLTQATSGNATGIGIAELCHRRVTDEMDAESTRMNCITASHVTGAMVPIDFPSDHEALATAMKLAGYLPPEKIPALWIKDTLHLEELECSEAHLPSITDREGVELIREPRALEFDQNGNLVERF